MRRSVALFAATLATGTALFAPLHATVAQVGDAPSSAVIEHRDTTPRWSGSNCSSAAALRAVIDAWAALSPGNAYLGNSRGAGAPGFSVALSDPRCGTFLYSVGLRDVEKGKPMLNRTRHAIGSLTKAVTAALTLIINDRGLFGPQGLDTPVDRFLSRGQIRALTVGNHPDQPRCPAQVSVLNRVTDQWETRWARCPDFHRITLRHLLHSNHGMWDFIDEADRNHNQIPDYDEIVFSSLARRMGQEPVPDPLASTAFGLLAAIGLLNHPDAARGGNASKDLEHSGGNTGFQLLGVILEQVTHCTYNALVKRYITNRLQLPRMYVPATPQSRDPSVAGAYAIATGAERVMGIPENLFGVYPLVAIHGNPAVNIRQLDNYRAAGGAGGGAGALLSDMHTYMRFIKALARGQLLSRAAQREWRSGFMPVVGLDVKLGYGLIEDSVDGLGPVLSWDGETYGSDCFVGHSLAAGGGTGTTAVVCRNALDMFMDVGELPPTALLARDVGLALMLMARQGLTSNGTNASMLDYSETASQRAMRRVPAARSNVGALFLR